MSSQIEINKKVINYLQSVGYRSDPIIDDLPLAFVPNIPVIPCKLSKLI